MLKQKASLQHYFTGYAAGFQKQTIKENTRRENKAESRTGIQACKYERGSLQILNYFKVCDSDSKYFLFTRKPTCKTPSPLQGQECLQVQKLWSFWPTHPDHTGRSQLRRSGECFSSCHPEAHLCYPKHLWYPESYQQLQRTSTL